MWSSNVFSSRSLLQQWDLWLVGLQAAAFHFLFLASAVMERQLQTHPDFSYSFLFSLD